ncbi:unnamed protein product [Chilo suppressalis]|uniref:Uncharacterized protein n=1 Tax=Chilo suppressalis TaxID=168631 RepID=A0ABN8E9Z4_CHISP|nr:unnamed protein product [Chilo suppressalis]
MAITTFEKSCNKIEPEHPSDSSVDNLPSSKIQSSSLFTEDSISGCESRCSNNKTKKKKNTKSPYLANDNARLRAMLKEKKNTQKRATNIVSSFPLAVNIYKANSDEFKSHRKGFKKIKKSVLTLPNVPAIIPQTCTVSDMNDSDYSNTRDNTKQLRSKRRLQIQKGKTRVQNKDYVFYDRDARFCSQMNIDLNSSSTDMLKFTGDSNRVSNKSRYPNTSKDENKFSAQDVWAVLRNINRFQFRPSPPASDDDSIKTPIKKKTKNKRKNYFRDNRVIETCRTEEFAYISSYDFESKSPHSFSHSSSFDRVTVIDKQEEISEICQKVEESIMKRNNIKGKQRVKGNRTNRNITKNNSHDKASKEIDKQLHQYEHVKHVDKEKMISSEIENISEEIANNKKKPVDFSTTPNHVIVKDELSKEGDKKKSAVTAANEKIKHQIASSTQSQYKSKKDCDIIKNDNIKDAEVQVLQNLHVNGITKVILCKGRNAMTPIQKEEQKRKPRLSTTIPRNEQLNTTRNKAPNEEHQKYKGLELKEQIKPYSQKQKCYSDKKMGSTENVENPKISPKNKYDVETKLNLNTYSEERKGLTKYKFDIPVENKVHQSRTNQISENKTDYYKRSNVNDNGAMTNKGESKHPVSSLEINKFKGKAKHSKPVQQLRDTVLKLLYKKVSLKSLDEKVPENSNNRTNAPLSVDQVKSHVKTNDIDTSTQTFVKPSHATPRGLPKAFSYKELHQTNKVLSNTRNTWTKGKWASEFIENVIRKIRNGIYYNQENICQNKTKPLNYLNEVAVQTLLSGKNITKNGNIFVENKEIAVNNNDFTENNIVVDNNEDLLPGFNQSPPVLKIKTLNMKEVSICHCTANVMVQFDVAHLLQSDNMLLKSSSFIPVMKNESQTKILKCKTTILNAVLPAELCSMIPAVLKVIMDSNKLPSLLAIKSHQNDPNLYTISELIRNEIPIVTKCEFSTVIDLSPGLKKSFEGLYKNNLPSYKTFEIIKPQLEMRYCNFKSILPNLHCIQRLLPIQFDPAIRLSKMSDFMCKRPYSTCTALQIYNPPNCKIINSITNTPLEKLNVKNLLEQMWDQDLTIRFKLSMPLSLYLGNFNKIVSVQIDQTRGQEKSSDYILSIGLNSLFSGIIKQNDKLTESSLKMIEYKNNPEKINRKEIQAYSNSTKARKKSFVKLYKKCKSTSNISGERCSFPLNKITNLDEFLHIIGSAKMMSSVFDGNIGNKILSSLSEMRNWIKEINPRQAMLILLLTNKKDTPNLVRFRPLLLQGIAVNRITRASELDMEIEVFEREHFNSFTQYKGIPYKLEAAENSNNLLEELFWIAKTTASDYQKPFDESSEKLLKSLLEKRKKLNPSYLRVMARYVGLGLLKSPRKK